MNGVKAISERVFAETDDEVVVPSNGHNRDGNIEDQDSEEEWIGLG